jgi:transglutaminase-like putative cysteine protease
MMKQLLFYTRLLLYLVVVAVPFFHPAILVSYDLGGVGLWFVIVPAMFLLAFYLSPPLLKIRWWLGVSGAFLLVASLIFGGFTLDTLGLIGVGALAFVLTVLVFKTQGKGRVVAALEILFTGALYFAFLNFSRSSEEIARASAGVLKLLFTAAVLTFFLHAAVLFIASFPQIFKGRGKRNLLLLFGVLAPVALLIAFLVPTSFIVNEVRVNPLGPELERRLNPVDEDSLNPNDGNLQGKNSRDRNGQLEGMDRNRWKDLNLKRGSGAGMKQYSVMIVATDQETLYLGSEYFGDLDPVKGLRKSLDEPLNDLADLRLLETWENTTPVSDRSRRNVQADVFSALPDRFFAYRPLSFTPTVLDKESRPFVYGYTGHFGVSAAGAEELLRGDRDLTAAEAQELARYAEVPFDRETAAAFRSYLAPLLKPGMKSYAKVLAILNGFRTFQYQLGFDERVNTAKILNFVVKDRTGDCTEFSNATAILARLAGVPSRVVTGYLASQDLMLPKHKQGLAYLRSQMPVLQKYDLNQLILVTNAHRHSWAQVYIAPFGWIDVEATSYAIPPQLGGDANSWNLVVPRMEKEPVETPTKPLTPLEFLIDILIGIGIAHLIALGIFIVVYLVKYLRLLVVAAAAALNTRLGLIALQRLLLLRLADRGYAYKPPSITILEYAEKYPSLEGFGARYTELRYRERFSGDEKTAAWRGVRGEFARIMAEEKEKGRGFGRRLKRFFSLKGFRY